MDITGIDKAEILAALYNAARPLGLGVLHFTPEDMTVEDARTMISDYQEDFRGELYFDYVKGRVMKIRLDSNDLETWLYNRDNGDGAAERVIERIGGGQS